MCVVSLHIYRYYKMDYSNNYIWREGLDAWPIVIVLRWNLMYRKRTVLNTHSDIERSAKRLARGCEKFISAVAQLFCLALPGCCLKKSAHLLALPCTGID